MVQKRITRRGGARLRGIATVILIAQTSGTASIADPDQGSASTEVSQLDQRLEALAREKHNLRAKSQAAEAHIGKLAHEQRISAIKELPPGVFVNLPEFWETVNEPSILITALCFFGEPVGSDALDAVQRILPATHDDAQQIALAAILYRYGRQSYSDVLAKAADIDLNRGAVTLYTMKRDNAHRDAVIRALKSGAFGDSLFMSALESWIAPGISDALWEEYQKNPHNPLILHALIARRDIRIQDRLPDIYADKSDETMSVIAGAGMTVMKPAKRSAVIADFSKSLETFPSTDGASRRLLIARLAGDFEIRELAPDLKSLVHSYAQSPSRLADGSTDEEVTSSIESLANLSDPNVAPLAGALLARTGDQRLEWSCRVRLAELYFNRLATAERQTDPILVGSVGSIWLRRRAETDKLFPIPEYLIPAPASFVLTVTN